MPKFVTPIDLGLLELLNAKVQLLSSDPTGTESRIYYNTTDHTLRIYNGSAWISFGRLDQMSAPAGNVTLNGQKITNLGTPTLGTDAVNLDYVQSVLQGLAWKQQVRAATTAAGTLASSFANGSTIDGVSLVTGDRILIKNQSSGSENGIYVVAASGAPARAADANTAAEVTQMAMFVMEGTANADTAWVNTTNGTIVLNTTALTFAQIGSTTAYTGGNGITVVGTVIALDAPVTIANGGTGQTTAAAALAALGGVGKYSVSVGDNSTLDYAVTHNLGTKDVQVEVYRVASPYDTVIADVERTSTSVVTVKFAVAPTTNQYRVVVTG